MRMFSCRFVVIISEMQYFLNNKVWSGFVPMNICMY